MEGENNTGKKNVSQVKEFCIRFWKRFYDLIKTIFIITWRAAAVNGSEFPTSSTHSYSEGVSRDRFYSNTTENGVSQEAWYVYWMPCLGILLFIPEFLVVWFFNNGHEYKWWSPGIAVYVACGVMSIWIIEIDLYVMKWYAATQDPSINNFEQLDNIFVPETFGNIAGFDFGGVKMRPYEWARILEQLFFITIILAKWLSPKGVMSRDQLSQLLLVFISMTTDILDLLDSLMFGGIGNDLHYVILVMIFYSLANMQFSLNFTATLGRPARIATTQLDGKTAHITTHSHAWIVFYTNIWAMLVTIFLQDGPFFILRLYFIFGLHIITFGNVFFTVKNGIVLIMDIYRVICIILDEFLGKPNDQADSEEILSRRSIKKKKTDNDSEDELNRAEICLTINGDSLVKAVSEFVLAPDAGDDKTEERFKRKNWRSLRSKLTRRDDDDDFHLIYEADILLEDQKDNDNFPSSINYADPVCLKDVRLRNIVTEKRNRVDNSALTRIQQSAVLRRRINQIVPLAVESEPTQIENKENEPEPAKLEPENSHPPSAKPASSPPKRPPSEKPSPPVIIITPLPTEKPVSPKKPPPKSTPKLQLVVPMVEKRNNEAVKKQEQKPPQSPAQEAPWELELIKVD